MFIKLLTICYVIMFKKKLTTLMTLANIHIVYTGTTMIIMKVYMPFSVFKMIWEGTCLILKGMHGTIVLSFK